MKCSCLALAAAAVVLAAAPVAQATVIFVAPTATTTGSINITAPISFTLTAGVGTNDTFRFVFQNWVVTADAAQNTARVNGNVPFTINGVGATYLTSTGSTVADNSVNFANNVGPTDGFLAANNILNGAAAGNNVTLSAGTYTLAAIADFNPLTTQTFNGNMFIASLTGVRISNIVSAGIPEPSTWALALGGAGLLGLVVRRRRGALS